MYVKTIKYTGNCYCMCKKSIRYQMIQPNLKIEPARTIQARIKLCLKRYKTLQCQTTSRSMTIQMSNFMSRSIKKNCNVKLLYVKKY